jgi:hypothetical protein
VCRCSVGKPAQDICDRQIDKLLPANGQVLLKIAQNQQQPVA